MSQQSIILSNNLTEVTQATGYGRDIEEILVTINISSLISSGEVRSFLLTIIITAKNKNYSISNIHSPADISDEGIITAGTIYILGPVAQSDISYTATLTFIQPA